MTRIELVEIVSHIKYLDWEFYVGDLRGSGVWGQDPPSPAGYYIQIKFLAPDSETGTLAKQHCRKWFISKHSCAQEVVRTAYLAMQGAILHEADEAFLYKGHAIYNPHVDPDFLATVSDQTRHRA